MTIDCNNCKQQVLQMLASLPSSWRESIANAICDAVTGNLTPDCTDVQDCIDNIYQNTELSEFEIDGTTVCIKYTDINGVEVERCFDFSEIINNSLENLDPKCLATPIDWNAMSYREKWQRLIDQVCTDCEGEEITTTSTTTTTTEEPTTTTTTTTEP